MRKIVIAAMLLAPLTGLAGCATGEQLDAGEYIDGERKLTEDGAFTVVLSNEDGMATVGENTFYLRVAMPDPNDPEAEGKGIPGATVELDAYMPNDRLSMEVVPAISYVGDGEYMIEGVVLEQAGIWQLDFNIAVGQTVTETVSFAFEVN